MERMERIAGTKRNVSETKLMAAVRDNQDVRDIYNDIRESVRKAIRIEGMLHGTHVYGNQTEAAELRADVDHAKKTANLEYNMSRYAIDDINNLVGGNTVDMSGTNRDICKRFYYKYRNIA